MATKTGSHSGSKSEAKGDAKVASKSKGAGTVKSAGGGDKGETRVSTRRLSAVAGSKADSVRHVRAEAPRPLSLKEKNVLEFLETYIRGKGVSPTYQEICQHFGFASFNSVQRYLKQLESKGYIQLPWANQKRAITLLHPASSLQNFVSDNSGDANDGPESFSNVMPAILPSESLSLPLLGRVAAGAPIEALEHDEFIEVPASLVRHADRTYALRVQGQSMIDDGILDGDVILVQRQNIATNGEIVVAMVGEEATVKRFYLHRDANVAAREAAEARGLGEGKNQRMIELRPANSSMSPMWYDPSEVQIRGVVVGLIRKFM
jgi:repressor LexA